MRKVDASVITALRDDLPLRDNRLQALRTFTVEVVRTRGWPSDQALAGFLAAGYSQAQALEVVLGVGVKTLSNYANHLANTPLDAAFAPAKWSPPARQSASSCAAC
jgi:alkylhydroperoxidase family enzyme